MTTAAERATYVGALVEDDRRLVLAPVDLQEPWEAFKLLRSWMRMARPASSELAVFETASPLESAHSNVVPFDLARRRSG